MLWASSIIALTNLGRWSGTSVALPLNSATATFEGWLPLSVKVERLENGMVIADEKRLPQDKTTLYRRLIQKAFNDLLTAISNPEHKVASDLYSARDALAVALRAKELYV
jgi:hypothetical protein